MSRLTGRLPLGKGALYLTVSCVVAFLIGPLLLLIPMSFSDSAYLIFPPEEWSFRWFRSFFNSSTWQASTIQSVQIATGTMLISTVSGLMAAFPLVRRDFRGKGSLMVTLASPLILPEVSIALGIYVVTLPLGLTDRWWMVSFAQCVLTIPFATIIIAAGLSGIDTRIEEAASSLGARPWLVVWKITLPLLRPSIVTAMAFTFIFSVNDLLIPLFLGSVDVVPLPVRIWGDLRTRLDLTTLAISVMWFFAAFVVLAIIGMQRAKSVGTVTSNDSKGG